MKNALLPRIKALAQRAQAAHKAMNDACKDFNSRIDWSKKDSDKCEMMAEMTAIDAAAGNGLAVGRHLTFGVADGGAEYIITKILKNVVEVEWIPLGDGYFSDAVALTPDKTKWVVLRGTAERQCNWNARLAAMPLYRANA